MKELFVLFFVAMLSLLGGWLLAIFFRIANVGRGNYWDRFWMGLLTIGVAGIILFLVTRDQEVANVLTGWVLLGFSVRSLWEAGLRSYRREHGYFYEE